MNANFPLPDWGNATRYAAIASALHADIVSGNLAPGSRLPSVRELCRSFTASTATATHALHLLEDAGLIEARPRSGFYVRTTTRPTRGLRKVGQPEAVPVALNEQRALMNLLRGIPDYGALLFATIDPDCYPAATLQRMMTTHARRNSRLLSSEDHPATSLALREQIARRGKLMGCDWEPEDITLTLGENAGVYALLRMITRPGDTVAIQVPSNMGVLDLLESVGVQVIEIPAHPVHGVSVEALAFALAREKISACVLTANFPNPTGSQMSDDAKRRTVALLAEHGVPLIEEDENGEMYFGKHRPLPFKAFDDTGVVHYCSDLSDLLGPGLSLGFAVTGKRLQHQHARSGLGDFPVPLFQQTVATFMASGQYEPHLRRLRATLAANAAAYRRVVEASFPVGTVLGAMLGGHLLWVELPRGYDAVKLMHLALAQGVRFSPGRLFGMDKSLGHCLRLNTGFALSAEIERDIGVIGGLCSQVNGGILVARVWGLQFQLLTI